MSESSSEEENSERLKEAVWSFKPQDIKINGEDKDSNGRQSYRAEVSKHEHDGNELGTTPEFRSHVAKKLGVILDGSISEVSSETDAVKSSNSKKREEEEDEEGFRLFSTSAPGKWMEQSPPPPPKRRPIPSSSDSDSEMEMRLREAAVSVSDLLSPSLQPLSEKTEKKSGETEEGPEDDDTIDTTPKKMKKKKKKRKKSTEASEKVIGVSDEEADVQQTVVEDLPKKKKKKKKKRTTLGEAKNVV